ncbi:MAG: PaaI family thioesterase [Limnohabitans sp.]
MSKPAIQTADPHGTFSRMLRGEVPRTPVLSLLGGEVESVDAEAGTLRARYVGRDEFRNPAGLVQGGMLSAMLDDVTASLVDATLTTGQGVATLSLNVSFMRPAHVGPIEAEASMMRRGKDICHVMGRLQQDGKDVATAIAVCKVVTS